MAAQSTYKELLQAKQYIRQLLDENERLRGEMDYMKGFTIQQCMDMACIALHEEFGFGPKYNQRFLGAFWETFLEYAKMCVSDAGDDPDIVFTKEKVDRLLRKACGEDILEFDERYKEENLYSRKKLEGE